MSSFSRSADAPLRPLERGLPPETDPPTGPSGGQGEQVRFWREYQRRRSLNHVAVTLAARAVQAALDAGVPVQPATRRRLRVALEEYEAVQRMLRERVRGLCLDEQP